jgi:predicted nucleotidyltransferase
MSATCEQKVMEVLLPQPFKSYSIRQISELIKISYALVHQSVDSLTHKKIIKAKKVGNSWICQSNLSADSQSLAVFSLTHSIKFLKKVKFGFLIDELKEKLNDFIYIMILFGSYAKGEATQRSDVDLLFVVQNDGDIENIDKKVKLILSATNFKVDFEVITVSWLLKMFEEKNSVGREVLEGSLVLHGAEQYYTLARSYDQKRGH